MKSVLFSDLVRLGKAIWENRIIRKRMVQTYKNITMLMIDNSHLDSTTKKMDYSFAVAQKLKKRRLTLELFKNLDELSLRN